MTDEDCEWGDCTKEATHKVTFTEPAEEVYYCESCLPDVRGALTYQGIRKV